MTHNFATSTFTKKRFMIDVVALHVIYFLSTLLLLRVIVVPVIMVRMGVDG
jgi:hypothetical protein